MRFLKLLRDRRGFTLVEIIISIGVLAVVSVFVLEMFIRAMNTERHARDIDNASVRCQEAVEYYKTFGTCDPNASDLPLVRNWKYSGEEDGSFLLYMYFDEDWKAISGYSYDGYTVRAEAGQIGGDGVQELKVSAVRHKPMVLERESEEVLMNVEACKYFPER